MANIKSQVKRIRTNEKRRLRNKAAKSEIKTRIKVALRAAQTGDEAAGEYLRQAAKRLDKAAARGIIHANQASNRKSALMHHAARLQASFEARSGEEQAGATLVEEQVTEPAAARRGARARAERPILRTRLPRRGRRAKAQMGVGEETEAGELEFGAAEAEEPRAREDEALADEPVASAEATAAEEAEEH